MPSQNPHGAFLAISAQADDVDDNRMSVDGDSDPDSPPLSSFNRPPWSWPAWQKRTGEDQSPFSPDFKDGSVWCSADDSQAVSTYVNNFWAPRDSDQIDYAQRSRSDNDKKGRILWLDWVNKSWTDWKVNDTIDNTLAQRRLDPYFVMKRLKVAKVGIPFSGGLFPFLIIL
jgi:hypothetical protein